MKMSVLRAVLVFGTFLSAAHLSTGPVFSQTDEPAQSTLRSFGIPLYDDKLLRLAEILGSLQYLRTLCSKDDETVWRATMEQLIEVEASDEPLRREKLTAAYNRGFRTFAAVHTACSDTAIAAEIRYRREGGTLTADILARYGN